MKIFGVEKLRVRLGTVEALGGIDFEVNKGEIVGIFGPNGAGKTTLLRVLGGLLRTYSGNVEFEGKALPSWDRRRLARLIAYVPQQQQIIFPYSAREIVLMGRLPHQNRSFFESERDLEVVEKALSATDSLHLADRPYNELSGGERQLVVLASALAQEPEVLILDEPSAFLDLRHQLQIYKILRDLQTSTGMTVVLVSHDLNLVDSFCSRALLLKDGLLQANLTASDGSARLSPSLLEEVFGVRAVQDRQDRIRLSFSQ